MVLETDYYFFLNAFYYQILGFGPDDIKNKYLQPFEELCADIQRARSEEEAIKNQGENKMPTKVKYRF